MRLLQSESASDAGGAHPTPSGGGVVARKGDFELHTIARSQNPADILTKHVDWGFVEKALGQCHFDFEEGLAELAAHI